MNMSSEGMNMHRMEDEGYSGGSSSGGGSKFFAGLVIFALIILTSSAIVATVAVVAYSYYHLTRKKMMQPSEVFLYMLGIAGVATLLWFVLDAPKNMQKTLQLVFADSQTYFMQHSWLELIVAVTTPFTLVGLVFGALLGWLFSLKIKADYKKFPEIKHLPSYWMNADNFKYQKTPLQRHRRNRVAKKIEEGANYILPDEKSGLPAGTAAGIDEEAGTAFFIPAAEIPRHGAVCGISGSGKTKLMENLIRGNAKQGITSIIINMKADSDLSRKLTKYAWEEGMKFYHFTQVNPYSGKYENDWNPAGQAYIDPFDGMTLEQRVDVGLAFQKYREESEKYKNDVKWTLQVVFNALDELEKYIKKLEAQEKANKAESQKLQLDLRRHSLKPYLTAEEIQDLNQRIKQLEVEESKLILADLAESGIVWDDGDFRRFHSALLHPEAILKVLPTNSINADNLMRRIQEGKHGNTQESWATPRSNFNAVINSSLGRWIGRPKNGEPYINLYDICRPDATPAVVLFDFNADSEEEISARFGKILTEMLTATSARRRNTNQDSNIVQVFFDEFQTIPLAKVDGLLEKARTSNIGVLLGQQTLKQLIKRNSEAEVEDLIDKVGTIIVMHGMKGTGTAELISRALGTKKAIKYVMYSKRELVWWKNFIRWDDVRRYDTSQTEIEVPRVEASELIALRGPNPQKGDYYTEAMIMRKTPKWSAAQNTMIEVFDGTKVHVLLPKQVIEKVPLQPDIPLPEHAYPKQVTKKAGSAAKYRTRQVKASKPEQAVPAPAPKPSQKPSTPPTPNKIRKPQMPKPPAPAPKTTPDMAKVEKPAQKTPRVIIPPTTQKKPEPAPQPTKKERSKPKPRVVSGPISQSVQQRTNQQVTNQQQEETPHGN